MFKIKKMNFTNYFHPDEDIGPGAAELNVELHSNVR